MPHVEEVIDGCESLHCPRVRRWSSGTPGAFVGTHAGDRPTPRRSRRAPTGDRPTPPTRSSHTARVVVRYARARGQHHARIRRSPDEFSSGTGRALAGNHLICRPEAGGHSSGSRLPLAGRSTGGRPAPRVRSAETARVLARHHVRARLKARGWSAHTAHGVGGTQAGNRPTVLTHSPGTARVVVRYLARRRPRPRGHTPGAT